MLALGLRSGYEIRPGQLGDRIVAGFAERVKWAERAAVSH